MSHLRSILLLITALAAVAAEAAPASDPKSSADDPVETDITLKDIEGNDRQPLACGNGKAAVVFFLAHDCPISNGYSPEINRIVQAFGREEKVAFHIVHPHAGLATKVARKHAKDYGYTVPVIIDTKRAVTRALKAQTTPQAIVVSPAGQVVYRGRIDDLYVDYGKRRVQPAARDLRDALSAVLSGKPVPNPVTDAIGCPIEQD